jgi:DNA-binding transcriptional MocR family regulator
MQNLSSGNNNILNSSNLNDSISRVINSGVNFNQYSSPKGLKELRVAISNFIKRTWNFDVKSENMIITTGSQQSLNLVADLLITDNGAIILEEPTYSGAIEVFKRKTDNLFGVPISADGIDLALLELQISSRKPKLIYVVPTFNNPTGVSWSLENRIGFLKIVNKHNIVVIEDDPYPLISFTNEKHVSLYELNCGKNIIYLGTFSKLISPSVNVGFILANIDSMSELYALKKSYDLGTSLFIQYIVLDYLTHYDLIADVGEKNKIYRQYLMKTVRYLKRVYGDNIEISIPKGGLFIFVKFNDQLSNDTFESGDSYYLTSGHKNVVRVNICNLARGIVQRKII